MMAIVQWETFEGETFHGAVVHVNQLYGWYVLHSKLIFVEKTFTGSKICESFLPWKFLAIRYNDIREQKG